MENKPKRPNLFDLATKELSQDGFFAWLLSWANPALTQCENFDPQLHQAGQDFVRFLLDTPDVQITKKVFEVQRQKDRIDIGVLVNEELFIIIEDKTNTKEHSKQFEKYYKSVKAEHPTVQQIVCIYLKTGNESNASIDKMKKKYKESKYELDITVKNRQDLISFFDRHQQIDNAIYTDFVARMRRLENAAQSYLTKPIGKWTRGSWEGFYMFLEKDEHLKVKDWNYVPNRNKGFVGLWWHFVKKEDQFTVYLQIEQGNLCFKVRDIKENQSNVSNIRKYQREMRNKLSEELIKMAKKENLKVEEPEHLGTGTTMTIAIVKREDWLGAPEEMFDPSEVVARLKEYETFLRRFVEKYPNI